MFILVVLYLLGFALTICLGISVFRIADTPENVEDRCPLAVHLGIYFVIFCLLYLSINPLIDWLSNIGHCYVKSLSPSCPTYQAATIYLHVKLSWVMPFFAVEGLVLTAWRCILFRYLYNIVDRNIEEVKGKEQKLELTLLFMSMILFTIWSIMILFIVM